MPGEKFLFKVEEAFVISGRGILLHNAGVKKYIEPGKKIKLIRPDGTELETSVAGVVMKDNHDILVDDGIKKENVPVGTEVWLID